MKSASILFTTLLLQVICSGIVFGQTRISGKITDLPTEIRRVAVLERYFADDYNRVDTVGMDAEGNFTFHGTKFEPGLYRMGFFKVGTTIDFIVSAADSVLYFPFTYEQLKSRSVVPQTSVEAEAYKEWVEVLKKTEAALDLSLNALQSDDGTRKFELLTAIDNSLRSGAQKTEEIKKKYPNTYTAKALCSFGYRTDGKSPEQSVCISRSEFFKQYYMNFIDFSNPLILNHKILKETINKYIALLIGTDNNKINDKVMYYSGKNDLVSSYLFKFMLSKWIGERKDDPCTHLLNSYSLGCSEDDPLNTKTLLEAMKNCAVGNTVPDLELADKDGKNIKLSDVYKSGKVTLVIFWRTTCSHCVETMPKLEEQYKTLESKGLRIYAVSIDGKQPDWINFQKVNTFSFANVWTPKELFKDSILKKIPVSGTPYTLIVDKDGKILHRLISSFEIEKILRKELGVEP